MPRIYDSVDHEFLHLPDALERFPTRDIAIWARCSTATQGARGSLERQADRTCNAVRAQLELREKRGEQSGQIRFHFHELERGRLSEDRHQFYRDLDMARRFGTIVVAEDVTRFLRAESGEFDEPTPVELKRFWNIVGNVPLATVYDPTLTQNNWHGEKSKLGMRASGKKLGRPKTLTRKKLAQILNLRGCDNSRCEPLGVHQIAKTLRERGFQISSREVQTALNLEVPDGRGGTKRFMDFDIFHPPYDYYRRLLKRGEIDDLLAGLAEDGQE